MRSRLEDGDEGGEPMHPQRRGSLAGAALEGALEGALAGLIGGTALMMVM